MQVPMIVALLSTLALPVQSRLAPDADGFIHDWLVLAPIAINGESGATEIDTDFLHGEASILPKAGDKVTAGGSELTWTAHKAPDYFIDFLEAFGKNRGEFVAGYAVTYVFAPEAMDVTLSLSSNDQGKAWLNGKEVFKFTDARGLEKDSDRIPVTLQKGRNVLILKVVNETNNWQGCARFMKGETPVVNVGVSLTPE
jgi:hypothetical protein